MAIIRLPLRRTLDEVNTLKSALELTLFPSHYEKLITEIYERQGLNEQDSYTLDTALLIKEDLVELYELNSRGLE